MKNTFLIIMMLAAISINTLSQTTHSSSSYITDDINITGHVIDAETNEHIPFVNIQIQGTTIGTVSDETGHFLITDLPVGEHVIVASCINYESASRTVFLKERETKEINFVLTPGVTMLDAIVVSANKYETKQREAASIVNVISPKLIETASALAVSEVLPFQTGLRVESTCNNCTSTQLRINGLEGAYTQIMIDSRPMFSALASVYGLEHYPTSMIDRIEVVRGGGSALFGSNAIAGVVNIITKEPTQNSATISNETSLIGGTSWENSTNLKASLITKNNKSGIFIFGGNRSRQPYDRNGDGFTELTKMKSTNAGFRAFHKTSDYSKLSIEYHHIYEFRRGGDSLELQPHETDITEQTEHSIDGGSVNFNIFTKSSKHLWTISSALQNINRSSYYGAGKDPNAYGKTHELTSSSSLQYQWNMDKCWFMPATLIVGTEFTYDRLNDVFVSYNRNTNQEVNIWGVYAQNEWKNDKVSLLIGARLDKHNMMKNAVFSPRLNMRYAPWQSWTFRASYASGYRAPQVFDEDLHIGAVGGEVHLHVLDPDLHPEYSHTVNISADWYKQFGSTQVNILAEGFYTLLNDPFILVESGYDDNGNAILTRTNASDNLYVAGLNAEGRIAYKNINFQIGYTFQKSHYNTPQEWSEDPEAGTHDRLLRSPDSYGYLTFGWDLPRNFDFSVTGTYTGSMLVPHYAGYVTNDVLVTTESFFDLNAQIKYSVLVHKSTTIDFKLGMKNIFNAYQKDLDVGANRDAGYIYGPTYPRTIFLGIDINI